MNTTKKISTTLLLASCSMSIFAQKHTNIKHPNVIVIYIDDMGIGDVTSFGGKICSTPNIDKLAQEGKIFTHYYSASPVSSASRTGITTGKFPTRNHITNFENTRAANRKSEQSDYLDPLSPSMARFFQEAGYSTAHIGKWHMGGGRDVIDAPSIKQYGFDEYISTYESPDPDPYLTATDWIWSPQDSIKRWNRTAYFIDKSIDFIARQHGNPFFLNLWTDDVHTPWVPESLENESKAFTKYKNLFSKEDSFIPVLKELDKQLGRFFKSLDSLGISKNTIVVFTSDNGPKPSFEQQRTLGLRGEKNSLFEGGINMPFIVRYTGVIKANTKNTKTILDAVDLLPTLCSMAGVKVNTTEKLDGQDLSHAFLTEEEPLRTNDLMWEFGRTKIFNHPNNKYHISPNLAIRRGNWKLLVNHDGSDVMLFNLKNDPKETKNIASENKELTKTLKTKVIKWFNKYRYPVVKGRWTRECAMNWYKKQGWLVGGNYLPATAINQVEMWQSSTWDPIRIDKELGWAKDIGYNTLRVFLHNLVWENDSLGLYNRMNQFLDICQKHNIKPMFVFFDDCHFPYGKLGKQPLPVKAFHNSGWLNCPLRDEAFRYAIGKTSLKEEDDLKGYIQGTMTHFKNDNRILCWELYNEPGRGFETKSAKYSITNFKEQTCHLLYDAWRWAREINPSQPITATVEGSASKIAQIINRANSDVFSIHNYKDSTNLAALLESYKSEGRPVLVTEWLARTAGSTVATCLPVMKRYNAGAINWGFVLGKSETVWPWSSRSKNGKKRDVISEREEGNVIEPGEKYPEPKTWFHDLLRTDGTPYSKKEIKIFRKLTNRNNEYK